MATEQYRNDTSGVMLEPGRQLDMTTDQPTLLGLTESEYRQFLPEYLQEQLNYLMRLYREYNPLLPQMYRHNEIDFSTNEEFFNSFLIDRNRRAQEIASPEYEEVARFAESQLPMDTYEVLCMDGRVKLIHTNGFTAEIASSTRTAGGLFSGFEANNEGVLELKPNSQFAKLLVKQLRKDRTKGLAEILDSHWTCAKRIGEEGATGNIDTQDSGLYRDVLVKQQMCHAIRTFLEGNEELADRNVALIQTTFNPVTGFMYMGLETPEALAVAEQAAMEKAAEEGEDPMNAAKYSEFNKDVLKDLIQGRKIISTGALIDEPAIRESFENHKFDINWQKRYVDSARQFWNNIASLKQELFPILIEKVLHIYPDLNNGNSHSQEELEQRAMLLLTNAFNAFLHNETHDEMEYLSITDETYEEQGRYPYGIHNEVGVKISDGGHPLYDLTMFVVTPGEPESVETAAEIVRANRRNGRITHPIFENYNKKKNAFTKSPVPVVIQEIVRETGNVVIPDDAWETLRKADWADMPANWESMDQAGFDEYLSGKGIDSHIIVAHIHELRNKMIALYEHPKLGPHARQLFKIFMPGICNQKREFQAIIPFVKVGRAMKEKNGNGYKKAA